ncbi:MAG: CAP domain-containing protein [Phycisphaerae bacterium]|nr:CAP domain-containing protein [Phycisphaerae bacterium]
MPRPFSDSVGRRAPALLVLGFAGVLPFLPGGCPLGGTGQPDVYPSGSQNSDSAGLSSGSAADVTLEERFPGCGKPSNAEAWRDRVWQLLNSERMRYGLQPLARNAVLDAQAEQYACEMIYYDFVDHENPVTHSNLAERAAEFGYEYWMIGENLAAGQTSPEQVVAGWMASPDHRENMLHENYSEVGVGLRQGGYYRLYWVLEFGDPL